MFHGFSRFRLELTTIVGAHKIQKIAVEKWRDAWANANSHIILSVNQKKSYLEKKKKKDTGKVGVDIEVLSIVRDGIRWNDTENSNWSSTKQASRIILWFSWRGWANTIWGQAEIISIGIFQHFFNVLYITVLYPEQHTTETMEQQLLHTCCNHYGYLHSSSSEAHLQSIVVHSLQQPDYPHCQIDGLSLGMYTIAQ